MALQSGEVKSPSMTKWGAGVALVVALYKFAVIWFGLPLPDLPPGLLDGVVGAGSALALVGSKKTS